MTTTADPAAIDLQYLRDAAELADTEEQHDLWLKAAAAVEALRARVVEIELAASGRTARIGKTLGDRALAAEARVVELAGALGEIAKTDGLTEASAGAMVFEDLKIKKQIARTILSTTPAEALERARAVGAVVKAARLVAEARAVEVESTPLRQKILRGALIKLDALDKEEE